EGSVRVSEGASHAPSVRRGDRRSVGRGSLRELAPRRGVRRVFRGALGEGRGVGGAVRGAALGAAEIRSARARTAAHRGEHLTARAQARGRGPPRRRSLAGTMGTFGPAGHPQRRRVHAYGDPTTLGRRARAALRELPRRHGGLVRLRTPRVEPLRWSGLESELAADAFQRRGFGGAISSAALLLGPRAIGPAQSA